MVNIMKNKKYTLYSMVIVSFFIFSIVTSLILKKNLFMLFCIGILGFLFCSYIFKNEHILLYFTIIITLLSTFLSQYIGMASNIPQIFFILMLFRVIYTISINKVIKCNKLLLILGLIMLTINTISYIIFINIDGGIVLYIWAILKRYSFFIVLIYIYNMNDSTKILTSLEKTFQILILVQFIYTFIQYTQGINYDHITGLFGLYSTGEYSHFILIILSLYISNSKKTKKQKLFQIFLFIHIIIYAVIAEVKLLFFVIPILVLVNSIIDRNIKNAIFVIITIILLIIGNIVYSSIYTQNSLLDKEFLNNYLTGDYGEVELNRFNFMDKLREQVFENDTQIYIGMGIGAAHPSAKTEMLQGPVYKENKDLKIDWFSLPYLITEGGIIGTFIFFLIYAYLLLISIEMVIKSKEKELLFIVLLSIICIIYNSSLISSPRIIIFTWTYIAIICKNRRKNKLKLEV